ncbi:PP2C family protein-serine/threonine phosphatase [Roseibium sediminicola]|uniref:Protein phosphatase 2C domain-containing protein n=1 Tax=Roseibium sediminicola TaxID=2933272 RepID=A0ABT0GV08_9HYPH|nr:protein phosphatase 2C domain-containing protein [Roseibium sp. CAU 1639]MCK7613269.1 protein phosphatase 2C domain-containing protein [Roseibium sp. CAU 1639]
MDTLTPSSTVPLLRAEAVTRQGPHHPVNQDSHFADPACGLFTVADGMGGHRDGDLASRTTVEAVSRLAGLPASGHDMQLIALESAVAQVSSGLFAEYLAAPEQDVSGTTSLSLVISGPYASCVWAGDSRLYLLRQQHLFLISEDHADAAGRLTCAVGIDESIDFGRRTLERMPGDVFILCTDGLLKGMDETMLANMAAEGTYGLADRLIARSVAGGSNDDITVITVWAEPHDQAR